MNRAILTGRLGKTVETKFNAKGTAWVQLSIGVKERYKVGDEWKEETYWAVCPIWGKRAEQFNGLAKGTELFVTGRLATNKWIDKNGVERITTQIIADDVKILSSPNGTAGVPAGDPQQMPDLSAVPF